MMTERHKNRRTAEAELVQAIRCELEAKRGLVVLEEVRSHGRARTDLMFWDGETLVGIEAKIRDWSRVIGQAVLNQQCYDRSFLAMWSAAISETVLAEASRFGVGVLAVGDLGMEVVLDAKHQPPIPELRKRLIDSVEPRVS